MLRSLVGDKFECEKWVYLCKNSHNQLFNGAKYKNFRLKIKELFDATMDLI